MYEITTETNIYEINDFDIKQSVKHTITVKTLELAETINAQQVKEACKDAQTLATSGETFEITVRCWNNDNYESPLPVFTITYNNL